MNNNQIANVIKRSLREIYHTASELKFLSQNGLKYWKVRKHVHITGWLTANEVQELYNLTSKLSKMKCKVVEIGSWFGKSSFILARGLKSHTDKPTLYCIDPFNSSGDFIDEKIYKDISNQLKKAENTTLKEKFLNNMQRFGVIDIITVMEGYSFKVVKKFTQKIDLLFIDGNHEYKEVLRDFKDWSKLIKRGGIIAFHDVDFDPFQKPSGNEVHLGPGLVIKRNIINSPKWTDFHRVDGLFYATRNS